jgi:putative phage-type endonuclease
MLLNRNPYVTAYKGWQRKISEAPEQKVNSAMLRGQNDEPIARELFINKYGINMVPYCIESDIYNFIGASLDGLSDCGKFMMEIKSQSIEKIKKEGIPVFHMDQMQHQFLSTDNTVEKCFYVTIEGKEIYVLEVFPDFSWPGYYIPHAKEFWKNVVFKEPPEMTNRDYVNMDKNGKWEAYTSEYKKLSEEIKKLEVLKESYKKELIALCNNSSSMGCGVKVIKKVSKGRIDYKEAFEVLNIREDQLEEFRKQNSEVWCITIENKKDD